MNPFRYDVVLTGRTLDGQDKVDVARKLAQLFKRDEVTMLRLLEGRDVKIRTSVEHDVALRYAEALRRIGVESRIDQETLEADFDLPPTAAYTPAALPPELSQAATPHAETSPPPPLADEALDFPTGDVDPVYVNSHWDSEWRFGSKMGTDAPPRWAGTDRVDLMLSRRHVFVQEHASRPLTIVDHVGKVAIGAAFITTTLAALAVPVVGIAVAGVGLGAAKLVERKQKHKHPGYGIYEQFRPEALVTAFAAGNGMWAAKSDCELRYWKVGGMLDDTKFYFVMIGKFHHLKGVAEYAGACEIVYIGKSYANDWNERTGWAMRAVEKFKTFMEAWRSLPNFRPPQMVK